MSIARGAVNRAWSIAIAGSMICTVIVGCDGGSDSTEPVDSMAPIRMQVLLDYSPTLSDAGALLYLASHPDVDLLAVTLAGTGEADCEPGTRTTRALLAITDDGDVPVGCGRNTPMIGDRDWPLEWRTEVNRWGDEMLPAVDHQPVKDGEQLLTDTLDEASTPITVVAVGPLTNLGVVLTDRPELAERIARIVIMGGAVTVPGNVEAAPAAEWNIYIDPESARRVLASGVPVTFVPLDATNSLPWTERLLRRLAALDAPAAHTVHQLAASRPSLEGFYLWDELAAMTAIEPSLVTTESMTVSVDDDGATLVDPEGVTVDVAVRADADAASHEFLRTLNGGILPDVVPLTSAELDYMVTMGAIDSNVNAALSDVFDSLSPDADDPRLVVAAFIEGFVTAVSAGAAELENVEPPPSLQVAHANYVQALTDFVATKDEILAAVAESDGTDFDQVMADVTARISFDARLDASRVACQVLEDYAFIHDGPRPCSSAAQR